MTVFLIIFMIVLVILGITSVITIEKRQNEAIKQFIADCETDHQSAQDEEKNIIIFNSNKDPRPILNRIRNIPKHNDHIDNGLESEFDVDLSDIDDFADSIIDDVQPVNRSSFPVDMHVPEPVANLSSEQASSSDSGYSSYDSYDSGDCGGGDD